MSNLDLIYASKEDARIRPIVILRSACREPSLPVCSRTTPPTIRRVSWLPLWKVFPYGCGDAVIGLNPVDDSVESVARILKMFDEFKNKWEVPTQICVLAHVTTQTEAAAALRCSA